MHSKTSHKNSPAPRLLDEIGATNLTLADAIAEIVANSFDAAIDGQRTKVEIAVDPDRVLVLDDGIGMTEEVLVQAVRLGKDMSTVVERSAGAKGHFGLGMKTACASIGRWWAVRTRPLGSSSEFMVVFDLAEWERRPDDADAWTIDVEEWCPPPPDSPLGDRAHGTAVEVRKLRGKDPMSGAVLVKMGEAFKPHLGQGDTVLVNGNPAIPHVYSFVPNSKIPIEITFGPSDQYVITGWVALDRQTHNDGDYGFNIYRRGQLVQTWCQDWFASHLMTSRIVGDVHMDFIDATFFKQGLQQSDVWRQASAEMKEFLKPVVKASRELSRKGNINSPVVSQSIVTDMYVGVGIDPPPAAPKGGGAGMVAEDGPGERPKAELPKLRVDLEKLELENGVTINITSVEKELPSGDTAFDYLADETTLLTLINTAHPLFMKTKDIDQLRVLAISDSILRYLVDECGMSGRKAAEVRGAWILAAMGVSVDKGGVR